MHHHKACAPRGRFCVVRIRTRNPTTKGIPMNADTLAGRKGDVELALLRSEWEQSPT
jgi:hypothetical protein